MHIRAKRAQWQRECHHRNASHRLSSCRSDAPDAIPRSESSGISPIRGWRAGGLNKTAALGPPTQVLKEWPQPQVPVAFGFLTEKPLLIRLSVKSTTEPSR